jgi:1-acyl-sn-glycerol-3-phosphate acyltransferase
MLFKLFCKIVFWLAGWKLKRELPENMAPCVMIASPHTSNWDVIFMTASFALLKIPFRFTIKKEWMKFPFRQLLEPVGAIPIDRSPKKPGDPRPSMVEVMTDLFKENAKLVLVVTPEGTRSLRTEWKTGFYHVAKNAGVPIALGFLDYREKKAGVGKMVYLTEDMDADMQEIMAFYKEIHPRFPEKFSIDQRYLPQ